MRAILSTREIKRVLTTLHKVVPTRSAVPALQCVRIELSDDAGRIEGTDMEIWARAEIEARIEAPGTVLVNARDLAKLLPDPKLDPDVMLETEGDWLLVKSRQSTRRVKIEDAVDYPDWPAYSTECGVAGVGGNDWVRAIEIVAPHLDQDATRYALGAVWVEWDQIGKLTITATNGRTLASTVIIANVKRCDGVRHLILGKHAGILAAIVKADKHDPILCPVNPVAGAQDGTATHALMVSVGSWTVYCRPREGRYPDYRQCYPATSDSTWQVDAAQLLDLATGACKTATDATGRGIDLTFDAGREGLSARMGGADMAVWESTIACEHVTGDDRAEITLDCQYLRDTLRPIGRDCRVLVRLQGSNMPAVIEVPAARIVIMPLSRSNHKPAASAPEPEPEPEPAVDPAMAARRARYDRLPCGDLPSVPFSRRRKAQLAMIERDHKRARRDRHADSWFTLRVGGRVFQARHNVAASRCVSGAYVFAIRDNALPSLADDMAKLGCVRQEDGLWRLPSASGPDAAVAVLRRIGSPWVREIGPDDNNLASIDARAARYARLDPSVYPDPSVRPSMVAGARAMLAHGRARRADRPRVEPTLAPPPAPRPAEVCQIPTSALDLSTITVDINGQPADRILERIDTDHPACTILADCYVPRTPALPAPPVRSRSYVLLPTDAPKLASVPSLIRDRLAYNAPATTSAPTVAPIGASKTPPAPDYTLAVNVTDPKGRHTLYHCTVLELGRSYRLEHGESDYRVDVRDDGVPECDCPHHRRHAENCHAFVCKHIRGLREARLLAPAPAPAAPNVPTTQEDGREVVLTFPRQPHAHVASMLRVWHFAPSHDRLIWRGPSDYRSIKHAIGLANLIARGRVADPEPTAV